MTFEIAPTLEAALQEADRWRGALDLHGPAANQGRAVVFLSALNGTMEELGIAAAKRQSCFVAQLAHETGEFRYMREISSGAEYEGRKDLGNTQPGDSV